MSAVTAIRQGINSSSSSFITITKTETMAQGLRSLFSMPMKSNHTVYVTEEQQLEGEAQDGDIHAVSLHELALLCVEDENEADD